MIRLAALLSLGLAAAPAAATPSHSKPSHQEGETVRQQFERLMDEAHSEMMAPGPAEPGWSERGSDPYAALAQAPGGTARNYLVSTSEDGSTSVTIVGAAALEPLLPNAWEQRRRFGPAFSRDVNITAAIVDGQAIFTSWGSQRRVGKAFCSTGELGGLQLRDPRLPAGEFPDEVADLMLEGMHRRVGAMTICWRYDREGEAYRVRYFLPDGRTLPRFDADDERVRIVPAAPLDRLLKPATKPPEPAGDGASPRPASS